MKRAASRPWLPALLAVAGLSVFAAIGMKADDGRLVVYCGRGEELIRPLIERFEQETGIDVSIRYAGTSELAATLMEEGANSPADVFFAQDAGALGALHRHNALTPLPADLLERVPARFRSPDGTWVGVSGRARVLVYNPERIAETNLPPTLDALTDPSWKGRIGWAPENASFQSFVTALRIQRGDAATLAWLKGIQANKPRPFAKNSAIVAAVAAGEIDAGLVNHYYLYGARRTNPDISARNHYFPEPGAGSLVNVAGVGILKTSRHRAEAERFIRYLLDHRAQTYFANETAEYPLIAEVSLPADLKPLETIATPDLDLNRLEDLEGTLSLIRQAGIF